MRARAARTKDGLTLILPEDLVAAGNFKDSETYEIFPLRDGFFLLAAQGALQKKPSPAPQQPTGEELSLLKKLSQIRFGERIPEQVESALAEGEKRTLKSLLEKRLLYAFYGGKYSKGVYNIPDSVYPLLGAQPRGQAGQEAVPKSSPPLRESEPAAGKAMRPPGRDDLTAKNWPPRPPINTPEHLEKFGYAVVSGDFEIKSMHARLADRIKAGTILGVRAFDRKLYLATRRFFSGCEEKIRPLLDSKGKSLEQIAKSSGLSEDAAQAALVILCDSGDLIEKRKGVYSIA